jgi:hypothetical protein
MIILKTFQYRQVIDQGFAAGRGRGHNDMPLVSNQIYELL